MRIVTAVESMSPASAIAGSDRQTAGRVQRVGFVVEDPAEDVEVVDQHVLEDAARTLDVFDGRRARIAARHHQHFRLPISPASMRALNAANVGSKRR